MSRNTVFICGAWIKILSKRSLSHLMVFTFRHNYLMHILSQLDLIKINVYVLLYNIILNNKTIIYFPDKKMFIWYEKYIFKAIFCPTKIIYKNMKAPHGLTVSTMNNEQKLSEGTQNHLL